MSGDRTTPRYDVVATTRRSWSIEQKQGMVGEIDVGGATLSEVARRHGIHASLLFRWRKSLGSVGTPPTIAEAKTRRAPAVPAFVSVMLPASTVPSARPSPIEIVLGGGRTLRVDADVDTAALLRIVEALEKSR